MLKLYVAIDYVFLLRKVWKSSISKMLQKYLFSKHENLS